MFTPTLLELLLLTQLNKSWMRSVPDPSSLFWGLAPRLDNTNLYVLPYGVYFLWGTIFIIQLMVSFARMIFLLIEIFCRSCLELSEVILHEIEIVFWLHICFSLVQHSGFIWPKDWWGGGGGGPPPSLGPRLHPQKEERVWYTLSAFWAAQDAARHVIVMITHRFGMAMHQRLSHAAIIGYSVVSHDNHMHATWHESDWCVDIQKQAPESARCVPDPLFLFGVGSGNEIWGGGGMGNTPC